MAFAVSIGSELSAQNIACTGTETNLVNTFFLTNPQNIIGDPATDDQAGNAIVTYNDSGVFDTSNIFCDGDDYCIVELTFDLDALQLAVDNISSSAACCNGITVLFEAVILGSPFPGGQDVCMGMSGLGINSGADVTSIDELVLLTQFYLQNPTPTVESMELLLSLFSQLGASACIGTQICSSKTENCFPVMNGMSCPNPPTVVVDVDDLICNGFCFSGGASATVSDVAGAYSTTWSDGSTGDMVSGLCAGDYSVVVTDLTTGQSTVTAFTVSEPPAVVTTVVSVTNASGPNTCDGEAYVEVTGGLPPTTLTALFTGHSMVISQVVATPTLNGYLVSNLCPDDNTNVVAGASSNGCTFAAGLPVTYVAIPTIGGWALICLTLLFLSVGLIVLSEQKRKEEIYRFVTN